MIPYSPLRYPGGKAKLYPIVDRLLRKNNIELKEYIEPYAGGAGLGLALLMEDRVRAIHINDIDLSIYSFWKSVLEKSSELCARIRKAPLTIEEWYRQKDVQLNPKSASLIELGFSTLYLNRTNRSGVIKGGSVIGGLDQSTAWKMDVRFNRETLIRRIELVASKKARINVYNMDAKELLDGMHVGKQTLTYLDPPYFNNGRRLYTNSYDDKDHLEIARYVFERLEGYWIVSYDDVEEIRSLYDAFRIRRIKTRYSASIKRSASEIVVFADTFQHLVRLSS